VKNNWFSIKAGAERAEVLIYDEIGLWGVTAAEFVDQINSLNVKAIDLRLNTPGGSVFDGNAIYNAIKRHPADVTVHIDGLAASMGSVIALAGDHVKMAANALYMIHNPWTIALGDAKEMRATADVLDKLRDGLIGTYEAKTGMAREEIIAAMDAETWYSADEAKAGGFVDEITNAKETKASTAFKAAVARFKNPPEIVEPQAEDDAQAKHDIALEAYQRRQKLNEWEAL
jgi:ATP-dependent Clp endopeptidase proteolytic subunit ClpP